MPQARKPRNDSITAQLKAMENAALPALRAPKFCKLRRGDKPFWGAIMASRARDTWSDTDLVVASQLARCQADIEREQRALDDESTVVENARGTRVVNARVMVLEQLARREMALMRTLRIAGTTVGRARDENATMQVEKDAVKARAELIEEDGLLAT